ncbi:iron(III) transport system substrate-binding protein [Scopulibacillus darangshiensis]|uniref:Iron(III) transport system substrate-binding protein n=1 Tax=Scopulibacillus darangshiensis TaxID=442528 RepID=A0A4R2P8M2_9BACL|nr:extracellular solute-binding protein [Scopulibacillus darangshiensis]TCP31319.1 iron(III) transport system substrate-binding protein [Scopulibacillus darangshiensis]
MKWRASGLMIAITLMISLLLSGCSSNGNAGGSGQKEKGPDGKKLEDTLVVYSPHGKDILGDFEKQFESKYHVDMKFLDMGSQEVLDRIRSEKNNPQADIWWGAPSELFSQAKDDGLLEKYKPSYAGALDGMFHDSDWYWTGTFKTPEVIMYNTKEVSKKGAPKDWDELLDPKWKDKIIIRYPLASGTMRTIFSAMIYRTYKDTKSPKKGYEWLKKLDANTKKYAANPEMMYNNVAKGVGPISVWDMPDVVMLKEQKGYPFDYVIPKSGTPVLTDGIAIVKNAPHLEAAKAFYEFVNTKASLKKLAEKYYRIPTRSDINQLPRWIDEADIKPMDIDWKVFKEKSNKWMEHWDQQIKSKSKSKE